MSEEFVKKMLEGQADYLTKKLQSQGKFWLFDNKDCIDAITDLTEDQISDFGVAEFVNFFVANKWKMKNTGLSMFIRKMKTLYISKNRRGREEGVIVFKPQETKEEDTKKKGKIEEILGTP